jgi:hypothetical protein
MAKALRALAIRHSLFAARNFSLTFHLSQTESPRPVA